MVTLAGAEAALPYITEINKLKTAFDDLASAISGNGTIWKFDLQIYVNGISTSISLIDDLSPADSAAVLNDIKNVIGTKINIQTNALGAIT